MRHVSQALASFICPDDVSCGGCFLRSLCASLTFRIRRPCFSTLALANRPFQGTTPRTCLRAVAKSCAKFSSMLSCHRESWCSALGSPERLCTGADVGSDVHYAADVQSKVRDSPQISHGNQCRESLDPGCGWWGSSGGTGLRSSRFS